MYAKNKRTTPMKDSVFGACLCVGSSSSHEFLFFVACVWLSLVRLLCYNQMHWNGCGLILHELCHVLHQQVLPGGLDNEHVHLCYQVAQHNLQQQQPHSARQSQSPSSTPITTTATTTTICTCQSLYEETLRRDWAGKAVETDLHYCMVNHKEFFAELSVTFLASGYPRVDHCTLRLPNGQLNSVLACSPPLMEPNVVARFSSSSSSAATATATATWVLPPQRRYNQPLLQHRHDTHNSSSRSTIQSLYSSSWVPFAPRPFHCRVAYPHCNKFYPFTRGQFQRHDPQMYNAFHYLWTEIIAHWEDPEEETMCHGSNANDDDDDNDNDSVFCWFVPRWFRRRKFHAIS